MHNTIPYIIVSMLILLLIVSVVTLAKTESKVYLDKQNNSVEKEKVSKLNTVKKDIIEKPKTVRKLSEHIATVVENNSETKKHVNKRKRKNVV